MDDGERGRDKRDRHARRRHRWSYGRVSVGGRHGDGRASGSRGVGSAAGNGSDRLASSSAFSRLAGWESAGQSGGEVEWPVAAQAGRQLACRHARWQQHEDWLGTGSVADPSAGRGKGTACRQQQHGSLASVAASSVEVLPVSARPLKMMRGQQQASAAVVRGANY